MSEEKETFTTYAWSQPEELPQSVQNDKYNQYTYTKPQGNPNGTYREQMAAESNVAVTNPSMNMGMNSAPGQPAFNGWDAPNAPERPEHIAGSNNLVYVDTLQGRMVTTQNDPRVSMQPQGQPTYATQPQGQPTYATQPQGQSVYYGTQPQGQSVYYGTQPQGQSVYYGTQPQEQSVYYGTQPQYQPTYGAQMHSQPIYGQPPKDPYQEMPHVKSPKTGIALGTAIGGMVMNLVIWISIFVAAFTNRRANGEFVTSITVSMILSMVALASSITAVATSSSYASMNQGRLNGQTKASKALGIVGIVLNAILLFFAFIIWAAET